VEKGIKEGKYLQARSAWQTDDNKSQRVELRKERLLAADKFFGK
jgi:hypothetical protein